MSCFLVHLVFQVPFLPHQTSCVSCSCLLALPFLPHVLQSVGAGCVLGAALHGVLTWQTSLCVTFVGFDTWPVMPCCWQPLSHDRVPSGTAFPHSHAHTEPVGCPGFPPPLPFPPHTSPVLTNADLEASGMKSALSFSAHLPKLLSGHHLLCHYRGQRLVLTLSAIFRDHARLLSCPWLALSSQASSPRALVLVSLPHFVQLCPT